MFQEQAADDRAECGTASTIHCRSLEPACSLSTSVAGATFKTVLSSVTISSDTHSTASANLATNPVKSSYGEVIVR